MAPPFTDAHIEDSPKRIRVLFGGEFVVDTRKAKLVWENKYYPTYFFPHSELSQEYLQLASEHPTNGDTYDLIIASKKAPGAVTMYSSPSHQHLNGLLKITFRDADAWFEEDEQIFVHPKDPYKRVDVLNSSRHIRIEVDGIEVASTRSPKLLYETGLPVRSYIPKTDCRLDLLVPSELTTACPYKGDAHYYHIQVSPEKRLENVVWWYRNPNLECAAINGLVAFYDEKVDVFVDGEKQAHPKSLWS
ncbi:hypothetical protein DFH08DRAFT_838555 [Mycena albidolilacea]|uniref:DUF427 domain-containing protein n=1 Tax=Mycena albidolilacea TaxID=1033008 RepID=A0AAD7F361_9AGAR|nr:hypothetical protein DFH08DRAFT_838555 [Mycena albidolilacea]